MKKPRITLSELETAAARHGLALQYDCGGCRVIRDGTPLFPDSGVCSTVTRREALHFITGYNCAWREVQDTLDKPKWPDDSFLSGYLRCMFWTSDYAEGSGDYEANGNWKELFAQLAPETLKRAVEDCRIFQERNADTLTAAYERDFWHSDAGHDFWLTRNGHGTGFWDRELLNREDDGDTSPGHMLARAARAFGNLDLYRGDDGKLYF